MKTTVRLEGIAMMIAGIALVFVGLIYGYAKVSPTDPGATTVWLLIACKIVAIVALALEMVALIMRQAPVMALPYLATGIWLTMQVVGQATGKASITIFGTGAMIIFALVIISCACLSKKKETYEGLRAEGG
jgi:hypothetical protein